MMMTTVVQLAVGLGTCMGVPFLICLGLAVLLAVTSAGGAVGL